MLAEAILNSNPSRSVSESVFTSYADVRSTGLQEKILKMMLPNLMDILGNSLQVRADEFHLNQKVRGRNREMTGKKDTYRLGEAC